MGINVDIKVINHKSDESSVLLEMATSAQGTALLRNTWKKRRYREEMLAVMRAELALLYP